MLHQFIIREGVRGDFSQSFAQGFITDQDIDRWANEAYRKYVARLIMAKQGFFEKTKTWSIVSGTSEYLLPINYSGERTFTRAVIVEKLTSNAWIPLPYKKRYDEPLLLNVGAGQDDFLPSYTFTGPNLVLQPTPTYSLSNGLRMVYPAMPPQMRTANCISATSTTIILDSGADPRDSYYVGARIAIVAGHGTGQTRVISGYTASNQTVTVTVAWDTTPNSTSVYAILIDDDFPELFYDLLTLYSCKKAFLKERSRGQSLSYDAQTLKELEAQFTEFIVEKTDQRSFTQPFDI